MTTDRTRRTALLLGGAALVLTAAACSSYHGAAGVHYASSYSSGHDRYVYGSSFYLGPGAYQVLYRPYGGGGHYYFRTRALAHSRYCGRYCYSSGGYHYHHASCGHFGRHAGHYGTRANLLIRRYGPR